MVVAVVDTGVQASHEDLTGSVLTGWDFTVSEPAGRAGGTTDPRGHGTHVAGIIAAHRDNRLGGTGVAPGAKILPVRVLDTEGMGWASDIARGIVWAADHGADIINLSLGGADGAEFYTEAVRYARSRGAVVVAAAGNEAEYGNPVVYPAAVPEAIAVAAVDADGRRALFSSYGYWVDIAAPGTGILAPCPVGSATCPASGSGYAQRSGTSMAAPHVAGAAALVLGSEPGLTPAQVEATLMGTADDIGAPGRDAEFVYAAGAIAVSSVPFALVRRPPGYHEGKPPEPAPAGAVMDRSGQVPTFLETKSPRAAGLGRATPRGPGPPCRPRPPARTWSGSFLPTAP